MSDATRVYGYQSNFRRGPSRAMIGSQLVVNISPQFETLRGVDRSDPGYFRTRPNLWTTSKPTPIHVGWIPVDTSAAIHVHVASLARLLGFGRTSKDLD